MFYKTFEIARPVPKNFFVIDFVVNKVTEVFTNSLKLLFPKEGITIGV